MATTSKEEMDLISGGFMMGLIAAVRMLDDPALADHPGVAGRVIENYASAELEKMTGSPAEDLQKMMADKVDMIREVVRRQQ
jgi:hypothetical protein